METQATNQNQGGTTSYRVGQLKRRLPTLTVFFLDPAVEGDGADETRTARVILQGINGDLDLDVLVCVPGLEPSSFPVSPGFYQMTPAKKFDDGEGTGKKGFAREVFQDPTAVDNANHPLPQDIPFGWDFTTRDDEVYIDITLNTGNWTGSVLSGRVVVQVTGEYNGAWWNTNAIEKAFSEFRLTEHTPDTVGTLGGG